MAATWKQVQKLAAKLGARVEMDEGSENLYAYTPRGYEWAGDGVTCLVQPYANDGQSWKREAYADLYQRMSYGLTFIGGDADGWWTEPEA